MIDSQFTQEYKRSILTSNAFKIDMSSISFSINAIKKTRNIISIVSFLSLILFLSLVNINTLIDHDNILIRSSSLVSLIKFNLFVISIYSILLFLYFKLCNKFNERSLNYFLINTETKDIKRLYEFSKFRDNILYFQIGDYQFINDQTQRRWNSMSNLDLPKYLSYKELKNKFKSQYQNHVSQFDSILIDYSMNKIKEKGNDN